MRLVKQKKKGECGPACLAMVLGIELDEAIVLSEEVAGFRRDCGLNDLEQAAVLESRGLRARRTLDWNWREPAILTVPSLNHRGILHFIVWDGERFLDPACSGLTYPDDAPTVDGRERYVSWAGAIVWSPGPEAPTAAARAKELAVELGELFEPALKMVREKTRCLLVKESLTISRVDRFQSGPHRALLQFEFGRHQLNLIDSYIDDLAACAEDVDEFVRRARESADEGRR